MTHRVGQRLRSVLWLPMLALLSACATIGAGSVNRDRLDSALTHVLFRSSISTA